MKDVWSLNRVAIAVNGLAVTAALLRCPITTVLLIALSNLLLIRNLERLRTAYAKEPAA